MLNTNLWTFVDDVWRVVYGFGTLYKICVCMFSKTCQSTIASTIEMDDTDDELIRQADLGLLMSGHLLEKQFNALISYLNKEPQHHDQQQSQTYKKRKMDLTSSTSSSTSSSASEVTLSSNDAYLLRRLDSPSVETFKREYFNARLPCIIENQMSHWPALDKWRYVVTYIFIKDSLIHKQNLLYYLLVSNICS